MRFHQRWVPVEKYPFNHPHPPLEKPVISPPPTCKNLWRPWFQPHQACRVKELLYARLTERNARRTSSYTFATSRLDDSSCANYPNVFIPSELSSLTSVNTPSNGRHDNARFEKNTFSQKRIQAAADPSTKSVNKLALSARGASASVSTENIGIRFNRRKRGVSKAWHRAPRTHTHGKRMTEGSLSLSSRVLDFQNRAYDPVRQCFSNFFVPSPPFHPQHVVVVPQAW